MSGFRLRIDYELSWTSDWHVGSGYGTAAVDRLLRRRGHNGPFYVPGSQIKGVLRNECERLAVLLGADVVDPHAKNRDDTMRLRKHFGRLGNSALIVDRLFGSRYEGDCLFVSDATENRREKLQEESLIRSRTSLDRPTGTVLHGRLFTTEMATSNSPTMNGTIRGFHSAGLLTQLEGDEFPCEYALLVAGLVGVSRFGGNKSVGLGQCKIIPNIQWQQPDDEKLRPTIELNEALAEFGLGEDWLGFLKDVRGEEP